MEKNVHLLVLKIFANQENFNQTIHWSNIPTYFQKRIIVHYCQTLPTRLNVSGWMLLWPGSITSVFSCCYRQLYLPGHQ